MISKFFVVFIFFSVGCSAPKYLVHNKSNNNNKELILITPTQEVKSKDNSTAIHLINKAGDVLKEWTVKLTALNSKMDSEGNLYVLGDKEKIEKLTNGIYRYFQIISPDNKVIWEYFNENLHHDFKLLPNGNILKSW